MATTDSNGVVFLEETDPISPFHTTINTLQQGTSDAITGVKEGIEGLKEGDDGVLVIHQVANVTERAALAAAYSPTAAKPLYVNRQDAPEGLHLERTSDGITWWTVPGYAAAGAPQTYTPSLSGPNLGSGSSVSGWYKKRPDLTVELDIKATLGSGFSLTNMVFGYPPGLVPIEAMREAPATAFFIDANGPRANAVAYCGGAGIAVVAQGANGVGTAITNSFPFSWAAGDQIRVQTTYSVAS